MAESTNVAMGYQDLPVDNLKDDLFNVEAYVNGLCCFILNCDTPMTISIQGDWGSGKTSMMNMVKNHLGEKILPIWFNTWQFSQFQLGNSLSISMMEILLKKLDSDSATFKKISETLTALARNAAVIITETSSGSSTLGSMVGQYVNNIFSSSFVDEISELKEQFQKAVDNKLSTKKNVNRVVVFIDDLDRLQPLKAIELLEVLKLFLDCKNCVFVLAIDYEVVTLGIRQKYGSDIDAAKGKSFFDKIIQLPFKVPVAQYDIKKYTKSMMKKMAVVDKTDKNTELFSALIKTSIGLNPRGMKRLFNAYQLLYNIMQPKEVISNAFDKIKEKEINILKQRILFAVVCMQMSFDAVYDFLSKGNVNIDILHTLKNIDDKIIYTFLKQRANLENLRSVAIDEGDGTIDDNILNAIFDDKISIEELNIILPNLQNFIKYFIQAIHTGDSDELTEKEVNDLRDILKCSTITSITPPGGDQGEVAQQKIENKEKNINLAQKVNDLLKDKGIGEFKIIPSKSKIVSGFVFTGKNNKEYDLRYVLKSSEKSIVVSIYINGRNQLSKDFYNFMGENPLDYFKNPIMNKPPCWYIYEDVLTVSDDEKGVAEIAETVAKAYNSLNEYIDNNLKKN